MAVAGLLSPRSAHTNFGKVHDHCEHDRLVPVVGFSTFTSAPVLLLLVGVASVVTVLSHGSLERVKHLISGSWNYWVFLQIGSVGFSKKVLTGENARSHPAKREVPSVETLFQGMGPRDFYRETLCFLIMS